MRAKDPLAKFMKTSALVKMTEDTTLILARLNNRLKGWNLIIALYSDPKNAKYDEVYGLAIRCRDLVILSIRLIHNFMLAALGADKQQMGVLKKKLEELDIRERKLSDLCRKAIQASKSTNVKPDSKDKQVASQQKEMKPTSSVFCPVGRMFVLRITPADRKEASV